MATRVWSWVQRNTEEDGNSLNCTLKNQKSEPRGLTSQHFSLVGLVAQQKAYLESLQRTTERIWSPRWYWPVLLLFVVAVKYERIKFLVIALKSSVEVYAWAPKPYHKFMAFKVTTSSALKSSISCARCGREPGNTSDNPEWSQLIV